MSSDQITESVAPEGEQLAQHVVSLALRRKLQRCYEHGTRLVAEAKDQKYDFDYAHTMFAECAVGDPGNLVYVEAMLDNLQRKYDNNKKGGRLISFGGRGAIKKAIAKQDWADILQLGPDVLRTNPWDVPALRAMAQACQAYRYNEVELRYLKNALDANPKDVEVNKHCARSLARMGQFDQAIACWHRIEDLKPNDREAPEMISSLSVERHRLAAGYAGEEVKAIVTTRIAGAAARTQAAPPPTTATPRSAPAATPDTDPEKEGRRREIQLTERQRLEQAVADKPVDMDGYLRLADLHTREGRYRDAEKVLEKALPVSGKDPKVRQRLEDAMILRTREQLAIAQQRAAAKNTAEARELVEQIRANLHRLELEIYELRSRESPQHPGWKFEVALRLKWLGNHAEAIKQFQEARGNREHKVIATIEIGECLQHMRQYAKALQCYQMAVEAATGETELENKKLAHYRAGSLAQGLKQNDVASSHFREVLRLDPNYRDARDRLDKIG